jgi:hypothetical protein
MSEGQRAMVAAKIANMPAHRPAWADKSANSLTSQKMAAERLNVSTHSVNRAAKVRDDGVIELRRAVEAGQVSVAAAAQVSDLDDDEQREVVPRGSKEVRARAKTIRDKKS